MGRAPCCDKANVKRGPWSPEEDARLKSYIEQHGTGGNWIALPQKIGLKRCGKSCRLRWLNYLRPNIKHGGFSEEEDNIICSLYISIGSRWSIIAAQLPGRTDNDIKNYWNTRLKKKLLGKQRKDQQQARRAGGAKQERGEDRDRAIEGDAGGLSVYWPEPSLPVYPIGKADHRVDDEQASIRKLLMKLGGRFSNDDGAIHQNPFAVAPPEYHGHLYDDPANLIAPLAHGGFSTELDEMYHCDPVRMEGLDCFFGSGGMVDDGNGTSTSESANWCCEVSPLIYPPMAPSYQGMQQCMPDDPVQFGMQ